MMPTRRFTVMVCGVMEWRYLAVGMEERSVRVVAVKFFRSAAFWLLVDVSTEREEGSGLVEESSR